MDNLRVKNGHTKKTQAPRIPARAGTAKAGAFAVRGANPQGQDVWANIWCGVGDGLIADGVLLVPDLHEFWILLEACRPFQDQALNRVRIAHGVADNSLPAQGMAVVVGLLDP